MHAPTTLHAFDLTLRPFILRFRLGEKLDELLKRLDTMYVARHTEGPTATSPVLATNADDTRTCVAQDESSSQKPEIKSLASSA